MRIAGQETRIQRCLARTSSKTSCTRRGETTQYSHDFLNRVVATTRHADANTPLTSTTEFDSSSRRRSTTDPYGRRTYYLYDQNNRITRSVRETVPGGLVVCQT